MAASDQIPGQEFEYVALRSVFFPQAIGHRDRGNERTQGQNHLIFE